MIPNWLEQHLERTGRLNRDGIARGIRTRRCGTCGQQLVTGLDADVAGLPVKCDPHPIDQLGEALATLTGRQTYDVVGTLGRLVLEPRRPQHIERNRRYPILAAHTCGQLLPVAVAHVSTAVVEECPF